MIVAVDTERLHGDLAPVREVIEQLAAQIGTAWNVEHTGANNHGNLTAARITLKAGEGTSGSLGGGLYLRPRTITLTGNTNRFGATGSVDNGQHPWFRNACVIRLSPTAALSIRGIFVPQPPLDEDYDGRTLILYNRSSTAITLEHNDSNANTRERMHLQAAADVVLQSTNNRSVMLVFDRSVPGWIEVGHGG